MCFWIGAYQLYPFLFVEASVKSNSERLSHALCRYFCTHELPSGNAPYVVCFHSQFLFASPFFFPSSFCFEEKEVRVGRNKTKQKRVGRKSVNQTDFNFGLTRSRTCKWPLWGKQRASTSQQLSSECWNTAWGPAPDRSIKQFGDFCAHGVQTSIWTQPLSVGKKKSVSSTLSSGSWFGLENHQLFPVYWNHTHQCRRVNIFFYISFWRGSLILTSTSVCYFYLDCGAIAGFSS